MLLAHAMLVRPSPALIMWWFGLSALLHVIFAVHSVFVALREVAPAATALYPINALVIVYVALAVARGSRATLLESPAAP